MSNIIRLQATGDKETPFSLTVNHPSVGGELTSYHETEAHGIATLCGILQAWDERPAQPTLADLAPDGTQGLAWGAPLQRAFAAAKEAETALGGPPRGPADCAAKADMQTAARDIGEAIMHLQRAAILYGIDVDPAKDGRVIIVVDSHAHGRHTFTKPSIGEALDLYFGEGAETYTEELDGEEIMTRAVAEDCLRSPQRGREVQFFSEDGDAFTLTVDKGN